MLLFFLTTQHGHNQKGTESKRLKKEEPNADERRWDKRTAGGGTMTAFFFRGRAAFRLFLVFRGAYSRMLEEFYNVPSNGKRENNVFLCRHCCCTRLTMCLH